MMTAEDGLDDPLLVKHKRAQRMLDCGASFYWGS